MTKLQSQEVARKNCGSERHSFCRSRRASLEVESDRGRDRAWCHVVCAAERRQEVVQHVVVRQVDEVHLRAPLVPVRLKEVVIPDRQVEEVS